MLSLIAEATSQPTASGKPWVSDAVLLIGAITALILALGGGAGIMAILNAFAKFRQQTNKALNQLNSTSDETREKVNEVAEKNAADVQPLPPSAPLTVPSTDVPITASPTDAFLPPKGTV